MTSSRPPRPWLRAGAVSLLLALSSGCARPGSEATLAALRDRSPDLEEIRREVEARDRRDSEREVAPLRQAEDAVYVDSSERSVAQVVATIVAHVREVEARLARGD